MEGQRQTLMESQVQLTIDDIKSVVGTLVIESIVKDKRIAELTAEIERLKNGTGAIANVNRISDVANARNRDDLLHHANARTVEGN